MTGQLQLVETIAAGNLLGEGVQWNDADGCLWWTDIDARRLHRVRWQDRTHDRFEVPERIGSFAFIEDDASMIVAFASGVARFAPDSGALRWLARPESVRSGRRFNDGRADRQGRFWTGTMIEDPDQAAAGSASLYCLDACGNLAVRASGFGISNGLCFSPDSRYCYFADSSRHVIYRYDFDADSGALGARQVFARTPDDVFPDGAAVDADGCVWSAQWGASQVVRYAPRGEVDLTVPLPTSQPSCVAFGGARLDLLFVTSARAGLTAAQLATEPAAGDLFVFNTPYTGMRESRYRPRPGSPDTRATKVEACANR